MTEDIGALGVFASHYLNDTEDWAHHQPTPRIKLPQPRQIDTATTRLVKAKMSRSNMTNDTINSPVSMNGAVFKPDVELTPVHAFPDLTLSDAVVAEPKPEPSAFAVLMKLIETLAGKDKLGKVCQYGLRILLFYSTRTRGMLTASATQSPFSADTKGLPRILLALVQNPEYVLLLLLQNFEQRSKGVVAGLSMYRQMLRCGRTPFKLINLSHKLAKTLSVFANKGATKGIISVKEQWYNKATLSEALALYYSTFDEALLFFKLGILSNPRLRQVAVRHEALAWYYNIWLGLYNSFNKLSSLKESQRQLVINQQVRERAKILMRNTISASPRATPQVSSYYNYQSPQFRAMSPTPSTRYGLVNSAASTSSQEEIDELSKQIRNEQIEILKLLCDFAFDTISVFHLKVPEPFHLSFGLGAGALALSKVWMQVKEDLQDK